MIYFYLLFFFFQAEDGIRDLYVTGVQTCALPICRMICVQLRFSLSFSIPRCRYPITTSASTTFSPSRRSTTRSTRSEERRVGKECRSRWSPDHYKKNTCESKR